MPKSAVSDMEKPINFKIDEEETPNTRLQRLFYQKYHINPLDTVKTMKSLKHTNL